MRTLHVYRCAYCGGEVRLMQHKAEAKRCTGRAVCNRSDCRAANSAEIDAEVARMMTDWGSRVDADTVGAA